jgi:hypothetical protein
MFVVGGNEGGQKQNGGGQENNNHEKRWFLECEADYMATNHINNTGDPINLMREDPDQYYLSCDDEDDRDYTHSNGNNNYSPFFFNVNVYNQTGDLFHLRRQSILNYQQTTQKSSYKTALDKNTINYSTSSKSLAKEK